MLLRTKFSLRYYMVKFLVHLLVILYLYDRNLEICCILHSRCIFVRAYHKNVKSDLGQKVTTSFYITTGSFVSNLKGWMNSKAVLSKALSLSSACYGSLSLNFLHVSSACNGSSNLNFLTHVVSLYWLLELSLLTFVFSFQWLIKLQFLTHVCSLQWFIKPQVRHMSSTCHNS